MSPFATVLRTPEIGRITSVSPGCTSLVFFRLFAQMIVLTDTSNMRAMSERVSPGRTTYTEIRSDSGISIRSAREPAGPLYETRALSPDRGKGAPAPDRVLKFVTAFSTSVLELGTKPPGAAIALEKGQKASAYLGSTVTEKVNTSTAIISSGACGFISPLR